MRFRITTTASSYSDEDAAKLKTLGFEFVEETDPLCLYLRQSLRNRKMKNEVTKDINSLEELVAFQQEWGPIIMFASDEIQIFDGHLD